MVETGTGNVTADRVRDRRASGLFNPPTPTLQRGPTPRLHRQPTASPRTTALLFLLSICVLSGCGAEHSPGIGIAAASSLRIALPDLIDAAAIEGVPVHATYAASGVLRQEIEAGAPVDLMIFAAADPIDRLIRDGYAEPDSRRVIATNALVLVVPDGASPLRFDHLDDLPPYVRIAIGDPRTVPVGQYARLALTGLGVWRKLSPQLVYGANVAAVLAYAQRGEVDAAMVYSTDASAASNLIVSDRAAGTWAPHPIVVAALRPGAPSAAREFLEFLRSDRGQAILRARGFGAIPAHDDS